MGNPESNDAGLTAARACQNQHWSLNGFRRFALSRIELVE